MVRALGRVPPWALAALLGAAYLVVRPPSADLAAQEYRSEVFDRHGLVLWDNAWFAGHHMPGYSLLSPPLGAWLGARLLGALAGVVAAWLFERIVVARFGRRRAWLGALWFCVSIAATLISGRITFLLGLTGALAATDAALHGRVALATALAALTTLASPVAGLFVAMGAVAWLLAGARGDRVRAAAVAAGALVPALVLQAAFPEGGVEPFVASAFWPALAALVVIAAVVPSSERVLRCGVVLYALATLASFLVDSPMGGNVTRLGAVAAGPVLACVVRDRHRWLLAIAAVALLYWQVVAPVRDWSRASGDPSVHRGYYAGVLRFLTARERREGPFRVEVPYTANHWEARWMAPSVALARGWERQLDTDRGRLFYGVHVVSATKYRRWLDDNAVHYVALPDADLDGESGAAEARLIATRPSYLRPVFADAHWRVFAVASPTPLADGGRITRLGTDRFTIALGPRRTTARARIRWTRWWKVTAGDATLASAAGGSETTVRGRGTVEVHAAL